METFAVVVVIFAVPVLVAWLVMHKRPGPNMVCTQCGHHGKTVTKTPGSTGVELLGWVLFLVPGLLYGLWRMNGRRQVCAMCGNDQLVPPKSPIGRKLIAEHAPR